MNKEQLNQIGIEEEGDIIFITVAKYKLFMSYGKIGMDAYVLYSHYMFTARIQHTNTVHANNFYCREGLGWTKARMQKAKNLLNELELIKTIQRRDKSGKITGVYIEIKTKTTPFEVKATDSKTNPVDYHEGGNLTANALTNKSNAEANKVKRDNLFNKFITDYKSMYNNNLVLSKKESIIINKLLKDNEYNTIIDKYTLLHKKCIESPNYYCLLPSVLLNNWNKLVTIKIKNNEYVTAAEKTAMTEAANRKFLESENGRH